MAACLNTGLVQLQYGAQNDLGTQYAKGFSVLQISEKRPRSTTFPYSEVSCVHEWISCTLCVLYAACPYRSLFELSLPNVHHFQHCLLIIVGTWKFPGEHCFEAETSKSLEYHSIKVWISID